MKASGHFHFKQFTVDQSGCAMKINTDGVLLSALVQAQGVTRILDIGTGTGVIALMLAQRFSEAIIDAIEIDGPAAETAARNFANAPFKNKPNIYNESFQAHFNAHHLNRYNLIVSNPPFYINSKVSSAAQMVVAKHAAVNFFEDLTSGVATHLTDTGECWLILPLPTARLVKQIAAKNNLFLHKIISVYSFANSAPHREILVLARNHALQIDEAFVIYLEEKVYSEQYREKLKDYLTIF